MDSRSDYSVRFAIASDEAAWTVLYTGYRAFYTLVPDAAVVQSVWKWVLNNQYGMRSFVSESATGELVGLANVRVFPRPASASMGVYLDDLFTDSQARGRGVAAGLLRAVADFAKREDANVVRWITAADNSVARSVYDSLAHQTDWVTYDMPPASAI